MIYFLWLNKRRAATEGSGRLARVSAAAVSSYGPGESVSVRLT